MESGLGGGGIGWALLASLLPHFKDTQADDPTSLSNGTKFQTAAMVLLPFFCLGGQRASVATQFSETSLDRVLRGPKPRPLAVVEKYF